ncbi:hypothetical protein [Pseudomonas sp. NPDC008258]
MDIENEWIGWTICMLIIVAGCLIHGISALPSGDIKKSKGSKSNQVNDRG